MKIYTTYETLSARSRMPRSVKEALAAGWDVLEKYGETESADRKSETGMAILKNQDDLHLVVPYTASYRFGRPRRITKKTGTKSRGIGVVSLKLW